MVVYWKRTVLFVGHVDCVEEDMWFVCCMECVDEVLNVCLFWYWSSAMGIAASIYINAAP